MAAKKKITQVINEDEKRITAIVKEIIRTAELWRKGVIEDEGKPYSHERTLEDTMDEIHTELDRQVQDLKAKGKWDK